MKGKDRHISRLKRLADGAAKMANGVVFSGAEIIKADAQLRINQPKHGRVVQGQRRKQYTASAPGEAPAYDTEALRSSIGAHNPRPLVAEVRAEDWKASMLEFGTSKMAERPYMRPARDAKEPEIQRMFAEKLNDLVRSSGR